MNDLERNPATNLLGHQWKEQDVRGQKMKFCSWCGQRADFAESLERCNEAVKVSFGGKPPTWYSRKELERGEY